MAIKFNFVSPEHGVTYNDAYGRILGGEFHPDYYHVYVGIYAGEGAREKEKAVELLHGQILKAQEEILLREQAIAKANESALITAQELQDAESQYEAGKLKQPALDKFQAAHDDTHKKLQDAQAAHARAYLIDSQVRAGLTNEAPVKQLGLYKYTFPTECINIDENGLLTALYHKLQDIEPFVGSFKV
jgi:hypothetical protein